MERHSHGARLRGREARHTNGLKTFTSVRAMIQYIGVKTHPDVCAPVQLIAPGAEYATPEEWKVDNILLANLGNV